MIKCVGTKAEWEEHSETVWTNEKVVVLTMDDDEPIKKEVISILERFCSKVPIIDVAPELYPQVFKGETYEFAPPGIIFFVSGQPAWRSDLGILDLEDHAWNQRILHDMIREFFGEDQ